MSKSSPESYAEKLKDPRWQKKRLEILNRDGWACVLCFNSKDQLHVHHLFYEKGKEPWEYNSGFLITLCSDCHKEDESCHEIKESLGLISSCFLDKNIEPILMKDLACSLSYMRPLNPPDFIKMCQKIKKLVEKY